jgi:alkylation response protein AidB-like acyl-CoA dehydrogenase
MTTSLTREGPDVVASDHAFRDEVRCWLERHPPPDIGVATTREEVEALRQWQRKLHAGRWIGVHWPAEYGGRGASLTQVAIYNEELARVQAPDIPGRAGVTLVGPTLLAHGTEEQRARWMPRILAGDDIWCQLFSEPGAGSDLGSISTTADRRGDIYVVTGQKVWSSHAQIANWGIALVRTDRSAPRTKGISMLAVPMTAKGIDVRPLRQMTSESEFNEVFLDEVEVPADNLLGPENEGWRVAGTTLANERGASFMWKEQVRHEAEIELLWKTCADEGLLGDAIVRQRLARSWIEVEIFRLHNARTMAQLARGEHLGAESSLIKLFWADATQRLYETACTVLGARALSAQGHWARRLLSSRANSIMGGTSEIQRNLIGERLLGLPKEPSPTTAGVVR